jgi:predicted ArsR family transcriptional regulator
MQITRKQIIDYLNSNHTATAVELSRALNVTAANIRHHIVELIQQEIVEEVGNLPTRGRGRPTKLYCLSKGALDHNLDFLADILLQIITGDKSKDRYHDQFNRIAQQMIGDFQPPARVIQRLNQVIQWLNDNNYQARWEASPNGPRVILGYCPYVAILDTNPEMCQIDTALVSQLVGSPMEQQTKLERSSLGIRQCIFTAKE